MSWGKRPQRSMFACIGTCSHGACGTRMSASALARSCASLGRQRKQPSVWCLRETPVGPTSVRSSRCPCRQNLLHSFAELRFALSSRSVSSPRKCCLTLRSSGPPPASRLARELASVIIHLAGQAPCRWGPLSSNVRRSNHGTLASTNSNSNSNSNSRPCPPARAKLT